MVILEESSPIYQLANKLVDKKAAVLVGAGFSRNAIPIAPNCQSEFPLFDDLAKAMQARIREMLPSNKGKNPTDYDSQPLEVTFLDIASLFEASFGRDELDNLISSLLPDSEFNPGEAHFRLLSLPWIDVYTTNYDTLLDRANDNEDISNYTLILESRDFREANGPRIIKLHGSLPKGPYIITNRDYETYETTHGFFSATLKSGLAGSVFCLIGFSGEDPNFTGPLRWAIDQLKGVTPEIYFIGLKRLPEIKEMFYRSQGIIPIEIADEVDDAINSGEKDPYRAAILKFLDKLQKYVDFIRLGRSNSSFGDTQEDKRRIAINQAQLFVSSGKKFPDLPLTAETLGNLLIQWRSDREKYPGWLIAPKRYRSGLWDYTEHWIDPVLNSIDKIPPNQSISLFYELNWRLETTACPLSPKWISKIDKVLSRSDLTNGPDGEPASYTIPSENLAIDEENEWIAECRFSLHQSLARSARASQDLVRYSEEIEFLERNTQGKSLRLQQLGYERALSALFVFDEKQVRNYLREDNWPLETDNFPLFTLRRASILAELGDLDKAEGLARQATTVLQSINGKIKPEEDISTHSQEAWGRLLVKALEQSRRQFESSEEDKKRNAELELLGLNPTAECLELVSSLQSDPRSTSQTQRREIGFDPGHFTIHETSLTFSSESEISDLIPSYMMLNVFETAGLPYHCGMMSLFNDGVIAATKYVSQDSPILSILSLLRTGNRDAIVLRFSRMNVAVMPEEIVNRLFSVLSISIPQFQTSLRENETLISLFPVLFAQRLMAVFPEILSRLSFRLLPDNLEEAYSLGLNLYRDPIIQNYYIFHDAVGKILPRTLYAMEPATVIPELPKLLKLPIPGYDITVPSIPSKWRDPFEDWEWLDGISIERMDRNDLDESIDFLLRIGISEVCVARQRALLRLLHLFNNRYLAVNQASEFGRVLWLRADESGMPADTGLPISAFLYLPEPEEGTAKQIIKESLLKTNFRRFIQYGIGENGKKNRTVHGFGGDPFPWDLARASNIPLRQFFSKTSNLIDWTADELQVFLDKIETHWASLREDLEMQKNDPMPFFGSQVKNQLDGIVRVLGDLLIPALLQIDRVGQAQICKNILKEIADYDISIAPVYPSLIQIDPSLLPEAENVIHRGLISDDDEEKEKANTGLYNWLVISADPEGGIPRPPPHLLDLMTVELLLLSQPGLDDTIHLLYNYLKHRLGDFSEHQITTILGALDKLMKENNLKERAAPEEQCTSQIRRDEVPHYRKNAAKMSNILYRYFEDQNAAIPEILLNYKRDGEVDVLPEVRKIWKVDITKSSPDV